MKCCKNCKHFQDAHYSRTYISPICTAHGGDDAGFFRRYVCGIDAARLYQPRPETREGTEIEHGSRAQDRRETEGES